MTFQAQRLLYGGDYNPEQWLDEPEILARDIRMLKDAGCNTVTLGVFAWSMLEPEDGVYELSWLEERVQTLYENGIQTVLSTPSGARPKWLSDRDPQVLRTDAARRKQLWGFRHNHCLTSPRYREKVAQIDTLLSRRLGRHPGVILWHISNELSGDCHCPLCQEAFREWLRQRYGTIDALNKAWDTTFWSHRYNSFDQIESPSPIGENQMHALKLNWMRFVTEQTADFVRTEVQAIRAGGSDRPVTTNLMYYFGGLNYFRLAKELDVVSWDTYPTWHKGPVEDTALDNGMCHDLMRSLKKGQPFLQMESCLTSTNWQSVSKLKRPGIQTLQTLQAIAHGADGAMFFQVRQSKGSSEKFHGALIDHGGRQDTRVYREAARAGELLALLEPVCGTKVPSQVALLYDWENQWAMEDAQGPRNCGLPRRQLQQMLYRAARRLGLNVDLIDETCSREQLAGYRIVLAPMMYQLRGDFARRLADFVRTGGTLVGGFWSGIADEDDSCFLGKTPHDLTEVFGVRYLEMDGLYDGEENLLVEAPGPEGLKRGREGYPCTQLCELIALEGATPVLVYARDFYGGSPALIRHEFGAGSAWYLAAFAGQELYEDLLEEILSGEILAGAAGEVAGPLPAGVEASTREDADTRYLFLQNFTDRQTEVSLKETRGLRILLRAGAPGEADEVQGHTDLSAGRAQPGDVLVLAPYETVVLQRSLQGRNVR